MTVIFIPVLNGTYINYPFITSSCVMYKVILLNYYELCQRRLEYVTGFTVFPVHKDFKLIVFIITAMHAPDTVAYVPCSCYIVNMLSVELTLWRLGT